MKYLVTLCFLVIVSFCSLHLKSRDFNVENYKLEHSFLIENINDSILNIIDKKPFIYYTIGGHGHIWSLVVPDNGSYIIVAGNTRTHDCSIDTISINKSILTWGLYSLPLNSTEMTQEVKAPYSPFYEELIISSPEEGIIFKWTNSVTYGGADSKTFEKNLNNLIYTMYWFACPDDVRKHLPSPLQ